MIWRSLFCHQLLSASQESDHCHRHNGIVYLSMRWVSIVFFPFKTNPIYLNAFFNKSYYFLSEKITHHQQIQFPIVHDGMYSWHDFKQVRLFAVLLSRIKLIYIQFLRPFSIKIYELFFLNRRYESLFEKVSPVFTSWCEMLTR